MVTGTATAPLGPLRYAHLSGLFGERWNIRPAMLWALPEDFTRAVRESREYAIVLEFGSVAEARRPYRFELIGGRMENLGEDWVSTERFDAAGYASGRKRVVRLEEFARERRVPWEQLRTLFLLPPAAPGAASFEIRSLAIVRTPIVESTLDPADAAPRECAKGASSNDVLVADFEGHPVGGDADGLALGATGVFRLWSLDDGTGTPTLRFAAGAPGSGLALRMSNPHASGWGQAFTLQTGCMDASAHAGIRFLVRGKAPLGHANLSLHSHESLPPGVGAVAGGNCVGTDPIYDCDAPVARFRVSDEWALVRLPWSAFRPGFDGSKRVVPRADSLEGLSFAVGLDWSGSERMSVPDAVELVIDDLSFFDGSLDLDQAGPRRADETERPR
jgi:hypothetical protein